MFLWNQAIRWAVGVTVGLTLAVTASPGEAADFSLKTSAPPSFSELENSWDVVVDIYFGGRRQGEARALIRPGYIRFRDPAAAAALLASHGDEARIQQFFQQELPSNSGRTCSRMAGDDCGYLKPPQLGVILDEDRFRVDVFLSAELASAPIRNGPEYLQPSSREFAAVLSLGAALSGGNGQSSFNLQNRTVLSIGDARLKSNLSYSSELGAIADDLLVELDKPDRRYSAGLFWTPGTNLIGRRRILGAGVTTQFDTRADRELIEGTSLPVFVQQRSVVDILIDGRLVTSQLVEAGNQLLDTSALPEGAYSIDLRIREPGRGARDEKRFFVKDTRLAPQGHVRFQAFAGLLSPTRDGQIISSSDTFYYQVGATKRLSRELGVEGVVLGTQKKVIGEAGLVYLNRRARLRVAGLVSTKGEFGALLQAISAGNGPAQFSFDLRRVWDRNGDALVEGSLDGLGFDAGERRGVPHTGGNYTQANATFGYRWGNANVRLYASYFDANGSKSDYSIGPSADWLILQRRRFQVRLEADGQKSRGSTSAYAGVRFLLTANRLSISGSTGYRGQDDKSVSARGRMVGNIDAEFAGETGDFGRYSVGAGLNRSIDATTGRASGSLHSRYGNARTDVLHDFGGRTQYGVSLQTGAVFGAKDVSVGGQNINESALLIGVDGDPSAGQFEVLVDEAPAAKVSAGQKVTLFLQPYRRYTLRLRPLSANSVQYDAEARTVTLFPGNVERQIWKALPTYTIFGQVIDVDGNPIANGLLQGSYGAGASNADGFFQIDVAANDHVTLSSGTGRTCQLKLGSPKPATGYFAAGKVMCQ